MITEDSINSLCVNVVYTNSSQFSDLPQQALDKTEYYYEKYIADTIESVFNRYNSSNVLIDKLSVNLGSVTPEEIPYKLSTALEKEIRKYTENTSTSFEMFQRGEIESATKGYDIQTEHDIVTTFLEYLVNPVRPWRIPSEQLFDIEAIANKALKICLSDNYIEYFHKLINLISEHRSAFMRFSYLASSNVIDKVLRKYFEVYSHNPVYPNLAENAITTFSTLQTPMELYEQLEQQVHSLSSSNIKQIRAGFLQFLFYGESEASQIQNILNETRNELTSTTLYKWFEEQINLFSVEKKKQIRADFLQYLLLGDKGTLHVKKLPNKVFDELYKQFEKQTSSLSESKKKLIRTDFSKYLLQNDGETSRSKTDISEKGQNQTKENEAANKQLNKFTNELIKSISETVSKRIIIANAGIILLHPMLVTFFKRLNYLDEKNKFLTETLKHRAVHLLQLLTGEKGKHYEHLLFLNKIICGLHPYFPIDVNFRPTKSEKEEVKNLLESVIKHWTIVQGTSVEGLQETFIRRSGAIESSGTNWILRVESKTVDILLDELPWGISLLVFPWNDYMIQVEWKR
jgi:hypothetical protein